jgi:hypothetical protein
VFVQCHPARQAQGVGEMGLAHGRDGELRGQGGGDGDGEFGGLGLVLRAGLLSGSDCAKKEQNREKE